MDRFRRFFNKLRLLFGRNTFDSGLAEEMAFHQDQAEQAFVAEGMTPEEARHAARRQFGNATRLKERSHETVGFWFEGVVQDFLFAIRQLQKNPGFACTAILMLALGIGANTGMFTVLEAMLLRALPIHDAQHVFYITENNWPDNISETGNSPWTFTLPVFQQLRRQKQVFSDVIAYVRLAFDKVDVRVGRTAMTTEADMVSGNFFQMLGVPMLRGRAFGMNDEQQHTQVVVLSYNFWTRAFSRNPDAVGQTLFVKGVPFTIVGIAAQNFVGVEPATRDDFWIPLQNRSDLTPFSMPATYRTLYGTKSWSVLDMMGRLAPGETKRSAEAALNPILLHIWYGTLGRTIPPKMNLGVSLLPATGMGPSSDLFRQPLRITMALVLLVLLIACTNVATLILARNAARQREMAVRVALGAGRMTLLRQLLVESVLLVAAGAALGWALAELATPMLARQLVVAGYELNFKMDPHVYWFTLGIAALAAIVFGLAPLFSALRISPTLAMKAGNASSGTDRNRLLGRRLAISAQTVLCVVLLVAAALMVRTLRSYQTEDLGVETQGRVTFGLNPIGLQSNTQIIQFYQNLLDKLRVLPGVESATIEMGPPGMGMFNNNGLVLDGMQQHGKSNSYVEFRNNIVGPDFFHVLGIPILQGRGITSADTATSEHVIVVNQTLVDEFLPHTNPLGHTIGPKGDTYTIVGVARDSKFASVDEPKMPMGWYPYTQGPSVLNAMYVEMHTYGDPMALLPMVRRVVARIDPNLPVEDPRTQTELFANSYVMNSLTAELTTFFGLLAALLVAVGLYGTLAYRVGRRTQEIGVRMALGASRQNVQWMVLRESLWMVAFSVAVGVPLSLAVGKWMQSQLYKLSWHDPLAMVGALSVVLLVTLIASWLPARSAASVNPVEALRAE